MILWCTSIDVRFHTCIDVTVIIDEDVTLQSRRDVTINTGIDTHFPKGIVTIFHTVLDVLYMYFTRVSTSITQGYCYNISVIKNNDFKKHSSVIKVIILLSYLLTF